MTKRIVTLLLALILVISGVMLAACKTDTPKTDDKKNEQSKPEENKTPDNNKTPDDNKQTPSKDTPSNNDDTPTEDTPTEDGPDIGPEPEFGTQAWINWLIEDDGETYNKFLTGNPYNVSFPGAKLDPNDTTAYDPSPWELWPWDWDNDVPSNDHPAFQMCWMFDRDEYDMTANVNTDEYEYVWEIWYRDAEDMEGEYKVVTTAPWSVYDDKGWAGIIYRIQTWNDGLNDLTLLEDGSAHEYEFVFVIYNNGEKDTENIIGWKQTWFSYTNSTQKFVDHALANGVITAPAAE